MPLTVASVFTFIPTNIWRPLKKFLTKDQTRVFDLPFKMSTKYTPALLMVMLCLSFANQFVRNVEIDCSTNGSGGQSSGGRNGYTSGDSELNDFCWNYETFLVAKALESNMRGMVTYPGVSGYNKEKDEVLRIRYYKHVWLILGKLMVISFLPYFFWKVRGTNKIKPLVMIAGSDEYSEEDQRLTFYLETIGFNGTFAWFYLACKIFGTLTPFVQWYYLCGFLGKRYKLYGVDVLVNFMDESAPWPNPMDALFPKMAKCEWSRYGFGGDIETKSAQCQLPMNNLTQWSFFIYWWWIAVVFVVNIFSLFYLFFHIFAPCRRYHYRNFVGAACREDVENLRKYTTHSSNGTPISKKHDKKKVIHINLGFGDWLVLSFIKKNLEEWKFRDFVRKMATTENSVIQLKQVPIPLTTFAVRDEKKGEKCGEKWEKGMGLDEPDGPAGHKAANMDIGFKQSIINHNHNNSLPSYSACETVSTDCDINNESSLSDSPESDGVLKKEFKNELANKGEQYSLNITAPVKVDRHSVAGNKLNKNLKASTPKKPLKNKAAAPGRPLPYGWVPPGSKQKPSAPPKQDQFDDEDWDS